MEKVALITAGGSGMGADSARRLAADGFKVGILSSSGKGKLWQRSWAASALPARTSPPRICRNLSMPPWPIGGELTFWSILPVTAPAPRSLN